MAADSQLAAGHCLDDDESDDTDASERPAYERRMSTGDVPAYSMPPVNEPCRAAGEADPNVKAAGSFSVSGFVQGHDSRPPFYLDHSKEASVLPLATHAINPSSSGIMPSPTFQYSSSPRSFHGKRGQLRDRWQYAAYSDPTHTPSTRQRCSQSAASAAIYKTPVAANRSITNDGTGSYHESDAMPQSSLTTNLFKSDRVNAQLSELDFQREVLDRLLKRAAAVRKQSKNIRRKQQRALQETLLRVSRAKKNQALDRIRALVDILRTLESELKSQEREQDNLDGEILLQEKQVHKAEDAFVEILLDVHNGYKFTETQPEQDDQSGQDGQYNQDDQDDQDDQNGQDGQHGQHGQHDQDDQDDHDGQDVQGGTEKAEVNGVREEHKKQETQEIPNQNGSEHGVPLSRESRLRVSLAKAYPSTATKPPQNRQLKGLRELDLCLLGISGERPADIHPLYQELLSAIGDRNLAQEGLSELVIHRNTILSNLQTAFFRDCRERNVIPSDEDIQIIHSGLEGQLNPEIIKRRFSKYLQKVDLDFLFQFSKLEKAAFEEIDQSTLWAAQLQSACERTGAMPTSLPLREKYAIFGASSKDSIRLENFIPRSGEPVPGSTTSTRWLLSPRFPILLSSPKHLLGDPPLTAKAALGRALELPEDTANRAQLIDECVKEYGITTMLTRSSSHNKADFINRWLLQQLRMSPLLIELLFAVITIQLRVKNITRWQEDVLYFWTRDGANKAEENFGGLSTYFKTRSGYHSTAT